MNTRATYIAKPKTNGLLAGLAGLVAGLVARLFRHTGGAAATEFAMIALALATFTGGVTEFGRYLYIQSTIEFEGERILRDASIQGTGSETEIAAMLQSRLSAAIGAGSSIAVTFVPTGDASTRLISLNVGYSFQPVTPLLSASPWPMTVTALHAVPVTG